MPWGDRTGPLGLGPLTGRRAGFCAGYPVPGFLNPLPGPFVGFGWGRGWGWRWWARALAFRLYPPIGFGWPDPVDETATLEAWKSALSRQLQAIEKRLAELEAKKHEAGGKPEPDAQ